MASSSASVPVTSASVTGSPSTASSPCAACKFLRRKCQPDCVFAPYFPPDQPQKFVHVHRVFGASNVTKLLNELHPYQREDAVNSLAYEADMRLRDPVYGCAGVISVLQHQLRQLQLDLSRAKSELSKYQSAAASAASAAAAGHGFVSVNHHHLGMTGFGFARDPIHGHHQHPVVFRGAATGHDSDLAARLGANGAYDAGLAAAMSATTTAAGIGLFGGQFAKSSAAGGDERSGIGPL